MSAPKERFVYIDLLRGWAGLVMIEVHVVNAFMNTALRDAAWFKVLNFINGLVAPSFLFIAGYSFVMIADRKWNDYLMMNKVFRKQLMRIGQIWIVGYALHVPFFSLRRLMDAGWNDWLPFWKVDVLHCIAFSLFLLLLVLMVTRTQKRFFWTISGIAAFVIGFAPLLYTVNIDAFIPLPIGTYLNAVHGSMFPVVPWSAFLLCGGIAGQLAVWSRARQNQSRFFFMVFAAGIVLIIGSLMIDALPITVYPPHNYWRASPLFFSLRLGLVMMLLATLWYWEQRAHSGKSVASVAGSESLVIYAFHLLAIYGLFFDHRSLSTVIGRTRSVPEVAAMTAVLVGMMMVLAYGWNALKKKNMTWARIVQYAFLAVILVSFILNPL